MTSRCIPSKFLTSLESNTIYLGKSLQNKYNCPDALCSESGSFNRPAQKLSEVINIIEKNYKNIPVSLSIFSGEYKEEDIFEYNIPSNLISIYSHSPEITTLFGNFSFSNSIEIKNVTLEGIFRSLPDKNIKFKECYLILTKRIQLENCGKVEFIDSNLVGSILFQNDSIVENDISFQNCNLTSSGDTLLSFKGSKNSHLLCSIENSSILTNFPTGILKTNIKDSSSINIKLLNSKVENRNEENFNFELVGKDTSTTKFSILSCSCYSKCKFMNQVFMNDSNIFYSLENNTFELENQMHHRDLIHNGTYEETLTSNNFNYINPAPLNTPLCIIKKKGGKYIRNIENNRIKGNTNKDIPLRLINGEDSIFNEISKGNSTINIGNGNGVLHNYSNTIRNNIANGNIFMIKNGKSSETYLTNNSKLKTIRDNILLEGKQGIIMNTDENSTIENLISNLKYSSEESMDKEYHNKLDGNIKSVFTTTNMTVKNSDKNIFKINGGDHTFSNSSFEHSDRGDLFSFNNSNLTYSTSNLISNEGNTLNSSGISNIDIRSTNMSRKGVSEKSLINQKEETNLEISASNIANTFGHCIEKVGNKTNTVCSSIKTKINKNYNIIQGDGTFTQSASQCLIGSFTTNIPSDIVPNTVTL